MNIEIQIGENNKVLRSKAKKIKEITHQIKELILDMTKIIDSNPNNVGLAAPQVNQSIRVIVVKLYPDEKLLTLINPELKKKSFGKDVMEEACLSLPGFSNSIKRYKKITVKGLDIDGKLIRIEAKGFLARIIQHEIDHLNGILISDY